MKIREFNTLKDFEVRTAQEFGRFLGEKPHRMGQVATLYKDLTATYLTDSLMNVYFNSSKGTQYQPINSMMFEWDLSVNFIKKVYIAEDVTDNGAGRSPIRIVFNERYLDKNDTFVLENRQVLFVTQVPRMLAANRFEYICTIAGNNANEVLDLNFVGKGNYVRYRSNYHPELSANGYSKFISNTERHRNYMSLHRHAESWSGQYAMLESVYLQTAEDGKDMFYKMSRPEKNCTDMLYYSKNNNLLWGKSNYDINGKCMDQDEFGRDIPMGDGIVPQIERFCDKLMYSELTTEIFEEMLHTLVQKSQQATGNKYVFIMNDRTNLQVGRAMKELLRTYASSDASYFYNRKGDVVKVGANFTTYHVQGNEITFMVDRCLTHEYPDRGYAIMLDISRDMDSGRNGIMAFTLPGGEMISGNFVGMGGMDGRTSGNISSTVHGSSFHLMCYSGVAVFNPYAAYILEESVSY